MLVTGHEKQLIKMKETYNDVHLGNQSTAIAIDATLPELTYVLGRPVILGNNLEWLAKTRGGSVFAVEGEIKFSLDIDQNRHERVRWNIKSASVSTSRQAKKEIEKALGTKKLKLLSLRDKYGVHVAILLSVLLIFLASVLPGTPKEKESYNFYAFIATFLICFTTSNLHKILHRR